MANVPPETVPVLWSVWTSLVPTARLGMTSADGAGLLAEVDERDAAEVLDARSPKASAAERSWPEKAATIENSDLAVPFMSSASGRPSILREPVVDPLHRGQGGRRAC